MNAKKCNKCGKELPLTEEYFYIRKDSKDGFRNQCKKCKDEIDKTHKNKIKSGEIKKRKHYNGDEKFRNCSKCGREFPVTSEYFYINRKHKHGFSTKCKECECKSQKQYYEENKKAASERSKRYREDNKEKISVQRRKYRELNKDYIKKVQRYHREKRKKEDLSSVVRYRREYYESHKEQHLIRARKWREKNKEKEAMRMRIHRANKRGSTYRLTLEQWEETKQYFDNKCAYCNRELPLEQEHFIAVSKGGEYTVNNILPACKRCNSSKCDRDFFQWYPKQRYYSDERKNKILEFLKSN